MHRIGVQPFTAEWPQKKRHDDNNNNTVGARMSRLAVHTPPIAQDSDDIISNFSDDFSLSLLLRFSTLHTDYCNSTMIKRGEKDCENPSASSSRVQSASRPERIHACMQQSGPIEQRARAIEWENRARTLEFSDRAQRRRRRSIEFSHIEDSSASSNFLVFFWISLAASSECTYVYAVCKRAPSS